MVGVLHGLREERHLVYEAGGGASKDVWTMFVLYCCGLMCAARLYRCSLCSFRVDRWRPRLTTSRSQASESNRRGLGGACALRLRHEWSRASTHQEQTPYREPATRLSLPKTATPQAPPRITSLVRRPRLPALPRARSSCSFRLLEAALLSLHKGRRRL